MNAAYLWGQLEVADKINNNRLATWRTYYEAFKELERKGLVKLPVIPEGCVHNAHMFYLKCRSLEERTEFISFLKERDIIPTFHYIPLHSSPAGMRFGRFDGKDEVTTSESEKLVRLPMYYNMQDSDVSKVIAAVIDFYRDK